MTATATSNTAMKESGIKWVKTVNKEFNVEPLFLVLEENKQKNDLAEDYDVLSLSYGKLIVKDKESNKGLLSESNDGYQIIKPGYIVLRLTDLQNDQRSLRVGHANDKGIITSAYVGLKPKDEVVNTKYIYYLLHSYDLTKVFYGYGGGIRQGMSFKDLKKLPLIVPPKQMQQKIVSFLDAKLVKIDMFITNKQQYIKKLGERKQVIINDSVINGIKPASPTKPSDVGLLGNIPEHWEVKKLKYISAVVLGKMLCSEDKGGYSLKPYLKSKNVQWYDVDLSEVEEMWFSEKELASYKLREGDLVVSEGGEVGKTAIWKNQLSECYIQNSVHKVTMDKGYLNFYYFYYFIALGKRGFFDSIVNRVSIGHLTRDKLVNVQCLVPPLNEQKEIVKFIQSETSMLNKAITKAQQQIDYIKEYRDSLITHAVTGQVEIRE